MDVHGAMVSEVQLGAGVTSMAWSAEKFKMEEGEDDGPGKCIKILIFQTLKFLEYERYSPLKTH